MKLLTQIFTAYMGIGRTKIYMRKLADHPTKFIFIICNAAEFLKWIVVVLITLFLTFSFIFCVGKLIMLGEIDLGHVVITYLQSLFIATIGFYIYWFDYNRKIEKRHKDYREFKRKPINLLFILINASYALAFMTRLMWTILCIEMLPPWEIVWSAVSFISFIVITISETHQYLDAFRPTWYEELIANYNEDFDQFSNAYKNSKWFGRDSKMIDQNVEKSSLYTTRWWHFWK